MKIHKSIILFIGFLMMNAYSFAQGCTMCSATIESTKQEGGLTGAGINMGVAYLSFFPYLMLGFFAFIFYKAYKKGLQEQSEQ